MALCSPAPDAIELIGTVLMPIGWVEPPMPTPTPASKKAKRKRQAAE